MITPELAQAARDMAVGAPAVRALADRLTAGDARIEQDRAAGKNVDKLETFWLSLLSDYRLAYDTALEESVYTILKPS